MTGSTDRSAGAHAMDSLPFDREQLRSLIDRLPVFPQSAAEVIRAARDGCITGEQLIRLTSHDQVLAGGLIKSANAAAYAWAGQVRTIEHAVLYLGEIRATQVVLAAAMKPILGVIGHHHLWEHSLDVAHVAHRIALKTRRLNASDAYVIGLLHDVGELLLKLIPPATRQNLAQLIDNGVDKAVAETMVCGATHAQAGADVLRGWTLPDDYAEAVEYHHEPEKCDNPAASVLYLAEQWTSSDGDTLAQERLDYALRMVDMNSLDARRERNSGLSVLHI